MDGVAHVTKRAASGRPKSRSPGAPPCAGGNVAGRLPCTKEPDADVAPTMVSQTKWPITRGFAKQAVTPKFFKDLACGTPVDSGDSVPSDALPLPKTASASGSWVHRAPGVPHALSIWRARREPNSGAQAPREREAVSQRQRLFENSNSSFRARLCRTQPCRLTRPGVTSAPRSTAVHGTAPHTAFTTTRKPSFGFGIGHICHCGV